MLSRLDKVTLLQHPSCSYHCLKACSSFLFLSCLFLLKGHKLAQSFLKTSLFKMDLREFRLEMPTVQPGSRGYATHLLQAGKIHWDSSSESWWPPLPSLSVKGQCQCSSPTRTSCRRVQIELQKQGTEFKMKLYPTQKILAYSKCMHLWVFIYTSMGVL